MFGYGGMWIDHDDNIYLCDKGFAIQHRDPDGFWTRIDDNDLLPAPPEALEPSESGLLYVCCKDDESSRYLAVIDDGEASSYSLDELGIPIDEVQAIVSDLAERVWIISQAPDLSGSVIIFDPSSELFTMIPWESGLLPFKDFENYAITFSGGVDRSMPQLGTLWCGSTPARMNFAPRTEMLLDKAPAFEGMLVPTDTGLILQLDLITMRDVPSGHYKWKTGFTRAGQETWLGLGFTTSTEFDVMSEPTE